MPLWNVVGSEGSCKILPKDIPIFFCLPLHGRLRFVLVGRRRQITTKHTHTHTHNSVVGRAICGVEWGGEADRKGKKSFPCADLPLTLDTHTAFLPFSVSSFLSICMRIQNCWFCFDHFPTPAASLLHLLFHLFYRRRCCQRYISFLPHSPTNRESSPPSSSLSAVRIFPLFP